MLIILIKYSGDYELVRYFNGWKQLRLILRPGIAIRLKFAASWIIRVWTCDEFPRSIRFDPESNTYILGEYDKYMSKPREFARTIRVFDHLWVKVE